MENYDEKIIEGARESLSFIQQLQEQVTACRRLLSEAQDDNQIRICALAVKELETLLWAKIRNDIEYLQEREKLYEEYENEKEAIKEKFSSKQTYFESLKIFLECIRQQFRLLLIFIDKKGFMPIGEENE